MDCNGKSLLQWDWEDLLMLNASEAGSHGKPGPAGLEIERHGGIGSLPPWFSGIDGGISGAGSDLGHAGWSKSSQSTSVNSSSIEVKTSELTLEMLEATPRDFGSKNNFPKTRAADSSPIEASVLSVGSLLSLKLGKRTYFEDVSAGSNDEGSVSMNLPSAVPVKRSKFNSLNMQVPRCQVEGCNLDLSTAKDYHRKHRVCESHSKCPRVIVGGLERRFCQQCSRFHGLGEFDEKKRSCRKRLSNHNARRRKQQPATFEFNPSRSYERKQHMGLFWNRFALIHSRSEEKFAWERIYGSKPSQSLGFALNPTKPEGTDWRLLTDGNSTPAPQCSSANLPSKATTDGVQIPNRDASAGYPIPSSFDGTRNLHRALSLLSTVSVDTFQPRLVSLNNPTDVPESSGHLFIENFSSPFVSDC